MDLLNFLQQGMLTEERAERYLTALRSDLLAKVILGEQVSVELLAALSRFCLDCEYVFAETPEDSLRVLKLDVRRSDQERLMLACFRSPGAEELPFRDVEVLRPLTDGTSVAVGAQYEEHPYPRWRFLKSFPPSEDRLNILVAGCGTGIEALTTARKLPHSRVTAMDLSRTSLAYALARAREFGVGNVRFIQGDLQDAGLLGEQFDQILCTGVLHHMANPQRGLTALKSVLKKDGTINLAVYSAQNRSGILEAIKLRKERGVPSTTEAIREFRQVVLGLPADHPARGATTSQDFYSISGARDLLFHVHEQNFTIRGLVALIEGAGLKLIRFGIGAKPEKRFKDMGFQDFSDLDAWERVEQAYPGTFSSMYRAVAGLPGN